MRIKGRGGGVIVADESSLWALLWALLLWTLSLQCLPSEEKSLSYWFSISISRPFAPILMPQNSDCPQTILSYFSSNLHTVWSRLGYIPRHRAADRRCISWIFQHQLLKGAEQTFWRSEIINQKRSQKILEVITIQTPNSPSKFSPRSEYKVQIR